MNFLPLLAWSAMASLASADHLITRSIHVDAFTVGKREVPAKDSAQRVWVGQDRLRIEDEGRVTIVRQDQKKVWLLDEAKKTFCTIELPVDLARYLPLDLAQDLIAKAETAEVRVTPTEETKKVLEWTARKFVLEVKSPGGVTITTEYWVTRDSGVDSAEYVSLCQETARLLLGGAKLATEIAKIDGVAVESVRTQKTPTYEMKRRDHVTSIEAKSAPEGHYDLPKGYSEAPYSPLPPETTHKPSTPPAGREEKRQLYEAHSSAAVRAPSTDRCVR